MIRVTPSKLATRGTVDTLYNAMFDDGRRIASNHVDRKGFGFSGSHAREYVKLFTTIEDSRLNEASCKLQSFWRSRLKRNRLVKWKNSKLRRLRLHFRAWKSVSNARTFFNIKLCRRVVRVWKQAICDSKRLRTITWKVFQGRIGDPALSITAVNLFFSEDITPPDAISANALRLGTRRQILSRLFRSWHKEIKQWQGRRVAAIAAIERSWRQCAGIHWSPELISLVFHMWHRSFAYRRAYKQSARLPKFIEPYLPEWNKWVHTFQCRQLLKQRAAKRGIRIFQLNKIRRWRWYTRYMKGLAGRLESAARFYDKKLKSKVILGWLWFARGRGRSFRRRGIYFGAWKAWSKRKKKLRQLKILMSIKATKNCALRGLRHWSFCLHNVHLLHAFRQKRITDSSVFYPVITSAYILNGSIANYFMILCFRRWRLFHARRVAWKSACFLHQRECAIHLMRTVFRAWSRGTGKWNCDGDLLSLEPPRSLDRACEIADLARRGLRCGSAVSREFSHGAFSVASLSPQEQSLLDAIGACDEHAVEKCLSLGARVNFIASEDGRTPLHFACSRFSSRYLKIVLLLLHCGADVDRTDVNGYLPIDMASNPQVAAVLHAHGSRLAKSPTLAEIGRHTHLMTLKWGSLGGFSFWRFAVHELTKLNSQSNVPSSVPVSEEGIASARIRRRLKRLSSVCTFLRSQQRRPAPWESAIVLDGSASLSAPVGSTDVVVASPTSNAVIERRIQVSISLTYFFFRLRHLANCRFLWGFFFQALNWLSSWSKEQTDTDLHFEASLLLNDQVPKQEKQAQVSISWRALAVCRSVQREQTLEALRVRASLLNRDERLIDSYFKRNIKDDLKALYPTMKLKAPPSARPLSSPLAPSLPVLEVVADSVPAHLHGVAVGWRRLEKNQQVSDLCDWLRASISPIDCLRAFGAIRNELDREYASFQEIERSPEVDGSVHSESEHGIIPLTWKNQSRIVSVLSDERDLLKGLRTSVQGEIKTLLKRIKVFVECSQALSQADHLAEKGVLSGAENLRSKEADIAASRLKARGAVHSRDREILLKRQEITDIESELQLAYSAQAERKRTDARRSKASQQEQSLPSPSWSEERLAEFIANGIAEVARVREDIKQLEIKAEQSKDRLLALITEKQVQRDALRANNILQLVVMDDLQDSRKAIETESKTTEKRVRELKKRVDCITSDLSEVRLALSAIGVDEAETETRAAAGSTRILVLHTEEKLGDELDDILNELSDDVSSIDESPRSQTVTQKDNIPARRMSMNTVSSAASARSHVAEKEADVKHHEPSRRSSLQGNADEASSEESARPYYESGHLANQNRASSMQATAISGDLIDVLQTPRFDIDDVSKISFDQEIIDRYKESLGSLFPDERIRLVDIKKQKVSESASSEAENLEMQREFGYDGGEEARGEEPLEPSLQVGVTSGKLRQEWNRIKLGNRDEPVNNTEPDLKRSPRLSSTAAQQATLRFQFGNVGKSSDEPNSAQFSDPRPSEEGLEVDASWPHIFAQSFDASVSMRHDDPPPQSDVEALRLAEMTTEERTLRRLNAADSFLGVGQAHVSVFGEASFTARPRVVVDAPSSPQDTQRARAKARAARSATSNTSPAPSPTRDTAAPSALVAAPAPPSISVEMPKFNEPQAITSARDSVRSDGSVSSSQFSHLNEADRKGTELARPESKEKSSNKKKSKQSLQNANASGEDSLGSLLSDDRLDLDARAGGAGSGRNQEADPLSKSQRTRKPKSEQRDAMTPQGAPSKRRAAKVNRKPMGRELITCVGRPLLPVTEPAAAPVAEQETETAAKTAGKPKGKKKAKALDCVSAEALLASALQGGELPDMSDEEYIKWMDDFVAAASLKTSDDDVMIAKFAARKLARDKILHAKHRLGLSGLGPVLGSSGSISGTETVDIQSLSITVESSFSRPQSSGLPHIKLSKTSEVTLARQEEGGYSYSQSHTTEPESTAVSSKSTDQASSVSIKMPPMELKGRSLKLPSPSDVRASLWSDSMPALVASMSQAEKEIAWRDFKQSSMSAAAQRAYAELALPAIATTPSFLTRLEEMPTVELPTMVQESPVQDDEVDADDCDDSEEDSEALDPVEVMSPTQDIAEEELEPELLEAQIDAAMRSLVQQFGATSHSFWASEAPPKPRRRTSVVSDMRVPPTNVDGATFVDQKCELELSGRQVSIGGTATKTIRRKRYVNDRPSRPRLPSSRLPSRLPSHLLSQLPSHVPQVHVTNIDQSESTTERSESYFSCDFSYENIPDSPQTPMHAFGLHEQPFLEASLASVPEHRPPAPPPAPEDIVSAPLDVTEESFAREPSPTLTDPHSLPNKDVQLQAKIYSDGPPKKDEATVLHDPFEKSVANSIEAIASVADVAPQKVKKTKKKAVSDEVAPEENETSQEMNMDLPVEKPWEQRRGEWPTKLITLDEILSEVVAEQPLVHVRVPEKVDSRIKKKDNKEPEKIPQWNSVSNNDFSKVCLKVCVDD
jgi:hypothetical protein